MGIYTAAVLRYGSVSFVLSIFYTKYIIYIYNNIIIVYTYISNKQPFIKTLKSIRVKKKNFKVKHSRINVVQLIFSARVKNNHSGSNLLSDYNYYNLIRNQSICMCLCVCVCVCVCQCV